MAAIVDATFRVLDEAGDALTTTRVAEVAGVSVGTLYQYFANREALINGALAAHLEAAIGAVERAVAEAEAARLALPAAAEHVVRAFLTVKAERVPAARALHRVYGTGKLDDRLVVRAATRRGQLAIARLLSGSGHEPSVAARQRAELACAALEGMVRTAIDSEPGRLRDPMWIEGVVRLAIRALAD